MTESNGNPCAGLGVCVATDEPGTYVLTRLVETRLNGYRTGLLGLPYNKKEQTKQVIYNHEERDIEQHCKTDTYGIDTLWMHIEGDPTKENKCQTTVNTTYTTLSTSTIGRPNGKQPLLGFANINVANLATKEKKSEKYKTLYGNFIKFTENDSRFSNSGQDALLYLLVTLSNMYKENDNALEVIYDYYKPPIPLQDLKNLARKRGKLFRKFTRNGQRG